MGQLILRLVLVFGGILALFSLFDMAAQTDNRIVLYALGYGFIPVRKEKKLPAERARIEYALEYGTDVLEIHKDAITPGQNVLIIDDVLATGGTAVAVAKLVEMLKGRVAGLGFILELDFLKGRDKLAGYDVFSLVNY